jgi:hypothetical protein
MGKPTVTELAEKVEARNDASPSLRPTESAERRAAGSSARCTPCPRRRSPIKEARVDALVTEAEAQGGRRPEGSASADR